MLALDQILLFAKAPKLTKSILTEYLQHELLDSFFKQKHSHLFTFIGGTAIRLVYGGQRFSEDLDFETTSLTTFDSLIQTTISDMQAKGFVIETRLVHKGAYHCYFKFPHLLHQFSLSGHTQAKITIKIDAAPTPQTHSTPFLLHNYGIFQPIQVAPPDILLAKKLHTIIYRKRPKGRDLYDVIWLWGFTSPNLTHLHQLTNQNPSDFLQNLIAYTSKLDLKALQQEVEVFLIHPQDSQKILLFPQFLRQKLTQLSTTHHPTPTT